MRKSTLFWSFLMNVSFKAWYKPGTTTLGKILCRAWCAKSILDSRRAGDDDAISQTLNWIVREEGIFVAFNHRSCLSLFYTCCFFESLVPISHPFKVCFFFWNRTSDNRLIQKFTKTARWYQRSSFWWIFGPFYYPKYVLLKEQSFEPYNLLFWKKVIFEHLTLSDRVELN